MRCASSNSIQWQKFLRCSPEIHSQILEQSVSFVEAVTDSTENSKIDVADMQQNSSGRHHSTKVPGVEGLGTSMETLTGDKLYMCTECRIAFPDEEDLDIHLSWHEEKEAFSCEMCEESFPCEEDLKEHEMEHVESCPYTCTVCKEGFPNRQSLDKHKLEHANSKHECGECEKAFRQASKLAGHVTAEHAQKSTLECQQCGFVFGRLEMLQKHIREHHASRDTTQCAVCGQVFADLEELEEHKLTHPEDNLYECEECRLTFNTKSSLLAHKCQQTEDRRYRCAMCPKTFSSKHGMDGHIEARNRGKPFQCTECNKRYKYKGDLMRHRKGHSGKKPHQCKFCGARFTLGRYLNQHLVTHGIGSSLKKIPVQCNMCDKVFSCKMYLDFHKLTHTGERPYQCNECGKRFRQNAALFRHSMIHTDSRPHQCHICPKAFRANGDLQKHIRTHTKDIRFRCTICNKDYSEKKTLTKHMRLHKGPEMHTCLICSETFVDKEEYQRHGLVHADRRVEELPNQNESTKPEEEVFRHRTLNQSVKVIRQQPLQATEIFTSVVQGEGTETSYNELVNSQFVIIQDTRAGQQFLQVAAGESNNEVTDQSMGDGTTVETASSRGQHPFTSSISDRTGIPSEVAQAPAETNAGQKQNAEVKTAPESEVGQGEKAPVEFENQTAGRDEDQNDSHEGCPVQTKLCQGFVTGEVPVQNPDEEIDDRKDEGQSASQEVDMKDTQQDESEVRDEMLTAEKLPNLEEKERDTQEQTADLSELGVSADAPQARMVELNHMLDAESSQYIVVQDAPDNSGATTPERSLENVEQIPDESHPDVEQFSKEAKASTSHSDGWILVCPVQKENTGQIRELQVEQDTEIETRDQPMGTQDSSQFTAVTPNAKISGQDLDSGNIIVIQTPSGQGDGSDSQTGSQGHIDLGQILEQIWGHQGPDGTVGGQNSGQKTQDIEGTTLLLAVPVDEEEANSAQQEQKSGQSRSNAKPVSTQNKEHRPFQCGVCNATFKRKEHAQRHILRHTGEKPHKCPMCEQTFRQQGSVKIHMRAVHTGETPFKCDQCGKAFPVRYRLNEHMAEHTGDKPFQCDICHKSFQYRALLKEHSFQHTDKKPFECSVCKKGFIRNRLLQAHMQTHSGSKPFRCELCGREFALAKYLQRHMQTHNTEKRQQHECDICGEVFSRKLDLKQHYTANHLKRQKDSSSFQSVELDSAFSEPSGPKKNVQNADGGADLHECEVCGRGFAEKSDLHRHLSDTHLVSAENKSAASFECELCGQVFKQSGDLDSHFLTHVAENNL